MKSFKPILAPNTEVVFDESKKDKKHIYVGDLPFPLLASWKLDGIRCVFKQGEMLSRSLKPIVNKQLREKFQHIIELSKEKNIVIDGEIYYHDVPFQFITSCVMTEDCDTKSSIKRWDELLEEHQLVITRKEVLDGLKFHCFDTFEIGMHEIEYSKRLKNINTLSFVKDIEAIEQVTLNNIGEVEALFEKVLGMGYEGLILRNPEGKYKFGRCTIKEGNLFKVKPFRTFDGQIIEVTQGTKVNPNAEKKINELGRSVTSKKKGDRILVEMTRDFAVMYEGERVEVSTSSLTHEDREKYWKKKDELIGQWIEYKGMLVGAKDVPRHPVFIRFREPKED